MRHHARRRSRLTPVLAGVAAATATTALTAVAFTGTATAGPARAARAARASPRISIVHEPGGLRLAQVSGSPGRPYAAISYTLGQARYATTLTEPGRPPWRARSCTRPAAAPAPTSSR